MQHIGFTGTRHGMTTQQSLALVAVLEAYQPHAFHHGDCVGADAQAHALVRLYFPAIRIITHPPTQTALRAYAAADEQRVPFAYLIRNKQIVTESAMLVAAPEDRHERQRSGTWATVRHARQLGKPVMLLWTDGEVTREVSYGASQR